MALEPSLSGLRVRLFYFLRKLPVIKLLTHFLQVQCTQVSGKTWHPFSLSQKSDTVHFLSDLEQLQSTKSPPSPHHEHGKGLLEKTRLPPAQGVTFLSLAVQPSRTSKAQWSEPCPGVSPASPPHGVLFLHFPVVQPSF